MTLYLSLSLTSIGCGLSVIAVAGQILQEWPAHRVHGLLAIANWIMFAAQVLNGDRVWAAIHGLLAVYMTWSWWRNRPKGRGRKALRELGAKSRARVQALVDRVTPSPIPSPAGGGA